MALHLLQRCESGSAHRLRTVSDAPGRETFLCPVADLLIAGQVAVKVA